MRAVACLLLGAGLTEAFVLTAVPQRPHSIAVAAATDAQRGRPGTLSLNAACEKFCAEPVALTGSFTKHAKRRKNAQEMPLSWKSFHQWGNFHQRLPRHRDVLRPGPVRLTPGGAPSAPGPGRGACPTEPLTPNPFLCRRRTACTLRGKTRSRTAVLSAGRSAPRSQRSAAPGAPPLPGALMISRSRARRQRRGALGSSRPPRSRAAFSWPSQWSRSTFHSPK